MTCIYEFEFFEEDGAVVALPFDMDGGTMGENLNSAVAMASDWLREMGNYALIDGTALPTPTFGNVPQHGGTVIAVSAVCSLDAIPAVTASEAANMLGVTRQRVSQMCRSGLLTCWHRGSRLMVSIDSIDARKREAPKAGRPKKETAGLVEAAARGRQTTV